ncbi:MAG TPA: N,N-dimethylformamidase beta subunit family domain-containing protein [Cyclobacteriaceae bacterium]|nr:N,N-dimethylformamidase beta subunit family domain-containing protein [Cyclobacteriaceae bacterium]
MPRFIQNVPTFPAVLFLTGSLFAALPVNSIYAQQKSKNIISTENAKTGTSDWLLTNVPRDPDEPYDKGWHRRTAIEGYVSHLSVKAGDSLKFYVSTDPPSDYKIDIYRMGYYGGKGGRLMMTLTPMKGLAGGTRQLTPVDGENHIMECNWKESAAIKIPQEWVSGVYLGKLSVWRHVDADAYVVFIVRDDRNADIIFQVSDFTWQSYNRWPQWRSMYDSPNNPWGTRRPDSYSAGFDRPYAIFWNGFPGKFEPLTNGSGEFLMTEFPLAFWLEKEGYDVTYISQLDAHEDGQGLLRAKIWMDAGHDEYWTQQEFDNVMKARDAGVHMDFLSGNSVSGKVVLLTGSDGRPNRGIRYVDEPLDDVNLMGVTSYGVGLADWTCAAPDHWAFEGTGMKKGDIVPFLVGWEFHGPPFIENQKDFTVLAEGPVTNYNGQPTRMNRTYATTIYTAPKGNYVFQAGTCWWNKVMTAPPGYINPPFIDSFKEGDVRIQRITKNIIDRMLETKISR